MKREMSVTAAVFLSVVAVAVGQVPGYNTSCVQGKYPPSDDKKVPFYTVNLDLPPEERWAKIAQLKSVQMKSLLAEIKRYVREWDPATKLIDIVDSQFGPWDTTLPYPFRGEITGIARAAGMNLGEVLLYNLFYEFFTVCTSIVAEDPSGKLYHARNLDFGLLLGWDTKNDTWEITEYLRPLIINVNYTRGGKTLFKAVHFAGYVGILTAVRPSLFTFSMDERFSLNGGFIGILEWFLGVRTGSWMGFLTRSVMENATDVKQATDWLNGTVMLAPAYFILGGNKSGEGYVITRARERALDKWPMSAAGGWYILETNYDHWENPLIIDNRRGPANTCMKKMTQKGVSYAGLFDVLSSQPVLNKLTTYTALMQVDSGHLETWLQNCETPCFPF